MKMAAAIKIPHTLPDDLRQALQSSTRAQAAWEGLTPLSQNEWICWTISVKQASTRKKHVKRVVSELKAGKRRPCCWMGCIHRTDKQISPSVRWVLDRQKGRGTA